MSFKSAWGFDPDEALKTRDVFRGEPESDIFPYTADEQRAARIPVDAYAQIYELRRMFRL